MALLLELWRRLRSSLWFVPSLIVLGSIALAAALVEVDSGLGPNALDAWPRLFGAGAAGARGLLSAVATSMITVAGVVFSITLVALSLASSQYSSRVLRNFMADRANQAVLGVFVGIFAYCLVVLRTIRGGDEGAFVPALAVLGGVLLAFVGIAFLIYFIHHIAHLIQAAEILRRIFVDTAQRIDTLFPEGIGEEAPSPATAPPEIEAENWRPVPSQRTGYITRIDADSLFAQAERLKTVIRMEQRIGGFAIEGVPLASVLTDSPFDEDATARVERAFVINAQRTTDQDAGFGIRQIVDVALKALSPGINDTSTAITALNYLTALLHRLAQRRVESPYRYDAENGQSLRVITRGPTFSGLVNEALDQIRECGAGNIAVSHQLLQSLAILERATRAQSRRRILADHARAALDSVRRHIDDPAERTALERDASALILRLQAPLPPLGP